MKLLFCSKIKYVWFIGNLTTIILLFFEMYCVHCFFKEFMNKKGGNKIIKLSTTIYYASLSLL